MRLTHLCFVLVYEKRERNRYNNRNNSGARGRRPNDRSYSTPSIAVVTSYTSVLPGARNQSVTAVIAYASHVLLSSHAPDLVVIVLRLITIVTFFYSSCFISLLRTVCVVLCSHYTIVSRRRLCTYSWYRSACPRRRNPHVILFKRRTRARVHHIIMHDDYSRTLCQSSGARSLAGREIEISRCAARRTSERTTTTMNDVRARRGTTPL